MKIDVMISANHIEKEKLIDKTVVVIDMLRATSVIITAINNGCKLVKPVVTVEEAIKEKQKAIHLLGGERDAVKIEGFDFSNSPLEYTEDKVKDKEVIITTTNGTKAINGAIGARNILIGAMINAKAVARKIIDLDNDVVILNAGTAGQFSIDDFICGGYMISCILDEIEAEMTDIATMAYLTYKENPEVSEFIKHAKHYKVIESLGFHKDYEYCCQKDIIEIVPQYTEGYIL